MNSINALLGPLEAATRAGSWENVEDIAKEISRLARLQRLSELKRLESALTEKFKAGNIRDGFHVKIAPGGSQGAKTPTASRLVEIRPGCSVVSVASSAVRPEPEITGETIFSEDGHYEPWRDDLAKQLNQLLKLSRWLNSHYDDWQSALLIESIVKRVAEFEEIDTHGF